MLELETDAYSLFVCTMNAKQSKDKYTASLRRFDFIKIPANNIEDQCRLAVQMESNRGNGTGNRLRLTSSPLSQ